MINMTTRIIHRTYSLALILAVVSCVVGPVSSFSQSFALVTNLVSFNGTNGQEPSGLMEALDGNIYGTMLYGGTNGADAGGVFRLTLLSGAFTNLVFFNQTNGAYPNSGLILGTDGNLYGTTAYGGTYTNSANPNGCGTIFKVTTNGLLTILASFDGTNGKTPNALLETAPGVFCGSANGGGQYTNFAGYGLGTLFKTGGSPALTSFLSFNGTNGASPSAGLTMTTNGWLYGTTTSGGIYEDGTIFRLAADGSIAAEFTFNYTNGAVPGSLILGRDGTCTDNHYGGSNLIGTVFKITTNLVLTTLVNFNGANGAAPTTLLQGRDGNFYGLTAQGGANGFGNLFELTTNNNLIPLYNFTGGSDGYGANN